MISWIQSNDKILIKTQLTDSINWMWKHSARTSSRYSHCSYKVTFSNRCGSIKTRMARRKAHSCHTTWTCSTARAMFWTTPYSFSTTLRLICRTASLFTAVQLWSIWCRTFQYIRCRRCVVRRKTRVIEINNIRIGKLISTRRKIITTDNIKKLSHTTKIFPKNRIFQN